MGHPWFVALGVALILVIALVAWTRIRRKQRQKHRDRARADFDARLPTLEHEFLAAAGTTGKPRGLSWTRCQLEGPPLMAVDRASGELYALVAATVSFAAIEGGDMEEVEAVGNLRAATAVFVHRGGRWTTDGRAVFNLDPTATLQHYSQSLEAAAS